MFFISKKSIQLLIVIGAVLCLFPTISAAQSVATVLPTLETSPCHTGGDVCDDSAIWIHPTDPAQSIVIGDDKGGGILVWDLAGTELQYLDGTKLMNNLDIRYNFPLTGTFSNGQSHTKVALVVADNESDGTLNFYKVNPATRKLESVGSAPLAFGAPYGGCMYHSPVSNKYYFFVNWKSGIWHQMELTANGSSITATKVREHDAGGQTEGCVADDINKIYYIGEEAVGVWRYGAEPTDGITRLLISGSEQVADTEGMSIYYKNDGTGYLIVSSQGNSTFSVYDRVTSATAPKNTLRGQFKVGVSGTIDATGSTDGLDVTNFPLGSNFPQGLLITHDGTNTGGSSSNHKFTPFERVASALNLTMDTTWDPRKVGDSGGGGGGGGGTLTPTITIPPLGGCDKKSQGDADCNGTIDMSDFEIWRKEFFNILTTKTADFDSSGSVGMPDFEIWRKNFFFFDTITATPTPSSVSPTVTIAPSPSPVPGTNGIWISKNEIAKLPITGQAGCLTGSLCANAWNDIVSKADSNWGAANVSDYAGLSHSQGIYAAALIAAKYQSMNKAEGTNYYNKVVQGLKDVIGTEKPALPASNGGKDDGSLAISRQLLRYIISADLLGIYPDGNSTSMGTVWGNYMRYMSTTKFTFRVGDGGKTIYENHPCASNACAMAGATRLALAAYLKDTTELNNAWNTFRRYTGDKSSPTPIEFSASGGNWYHVSSSDNVNKLGINPKGATCFGTTYPADGVIPNDQGRGGDCPSNSSSVPPYTQYPWEGLQGAYAQAFILNRLGYKLNGLGPFDINDRALLRAVQYQWSLQQKFGGSWYDSGRASWVKHLAFKFYNFKPLSYTSSDEGRNMAFTQWTLP